MISTVLKTIQDEFQNNWVGEIQFADGILKPTTDNWIHVDVEAINNSNLSYEGCQDGRFAAYVTCYARNKVQAAILTDSVNTFICNRKVGSVYVRTWSPINQGIIGDSYFYKIAIDVDTVS